VGLKREGTASLAENPASRKGKAWLLACGLFLGVVIALAGRHTLDYTSSDKFCAQACHSHPHATQMWLQSAHYSNKRGVVTHCTDCHLPPSGFQYLTEKARLGMHDAYAQIFRDVSNIDWSRERQLERARTFSYDSACVRCHSNLFSQGLSNVAGTLPPAPQQTSPEQVREMRIVARRMEAHLYYQRNREKLRCINCHLFEGHRIPKETRPRTAVSEDVRFPLTPAGFRNYTEAVPVSDIKFHMIAVPGGTLEAGSPALGACRQRDAGPVQTITVGPFWMTQAAVSCRELDSFLSQRRSQSAVPAGTEELAAAYVDWLSHSTGKKYRLPTEVELEYACIADGTMPAWVQTENRATPDASADVAELNAWGFMDLPDAATELTSDAPQSPQGAWWHSDRIGSVFRVVRVPEGNQPAANANSNSAGRTPLVPPVQPRWAAPGKS